MRKYISIGKDNIASQQTHRNGKWFLKFNHKLKFLEDTTTDTIGQMFILIRASTGNKNSGTASSVSGNQYSAVSTGAEIDLFGRIWYVDN